MPPLLQSLDDLAQTILARPARLGGVHLVVLDGPAGSGKTTLAARLQAAFDRSPGSPVTALVHLDDLYEGWSGLRADRGSGTPTRRLTADLLLPLAAGRSGRWRRYDWGRAAFAEWHTVEVPAVLLLEGCGAADPSFDAWTSARFWVQAPRELRIRRGHERDGAQMTAHWQAWQDEEDALFRADRTKERADWLVDGNPLLAHDPEREVVLLARDGSL